MRLIWMCAIVSACSAPANEALPGGPPRSPRPCKDADLVATMQNEAAIANQKRVDDAISAYESAHALTAISDPTHEIGLHSGAPEIDPIDQAVREKRGDQVIDIGDEVVLVHYLGIVCGGPLHVDYRIAHDTDGRLTVLRVDFGYHTTADVEQCGVCYRGCGMPSDQTWMAWSLPAAHAADVTIADVPVTIDELAVDCEITRMPD